MGEYAEMMLDGTCCCSCGEYLGDGDGFAAYCASCKPETEKVIVPANQKAPKPKKPVKCTNPDCGRRFVDENAMRNHLRTFHIDKVAMREKQEKDKKLNAIRNAAPALLEALIEARFYVKMALDNCYNPVAEKKLEKIDGAIAAARGGVMCDDEHYFEALDNDGDRPFDDDEDDRDFFDDDYYDDGDL